MPDDTPSATNGFRSLVQQIQEKDDVEQARPPRRRLSLRRDPRAEAAAAQPAPATNGLPLRLLSRRWL